MIVTNANQLPIATSGLDNRPKKYCIQICGMVCFSSASVLEALKVGLFDAMKRTVDTGIQMKRKGQETKFTVSQYRSTTHMQIEQQKPLYHYT